VGNRPPLPFSFDIAVGRRWLADGILNLFLFVPLGLAVGWNSQSLKVPALFGLLLSIFLELTQIIVPGRDPALGDILFNSFGALLGGLIALRRRELLEPGGKTSAALAVSSIAVAGSLMIATAFLLSPVGGEDLHSIGRNGNDLVLRYPSRASALGLDQPEYRLPGAIPGSAGANAMPVSVRRERAHWRISPGTARQATIGPTVGQGWALLAYPDAIGRRWSSIVNAMWMLALCLPIGFWARGRLRPTAAAVLVILIVLVPKLTGTSATGWLEWIGAAVGFTAGAVAVRVSTKPTRTALTTSVSPPT
jgi:hypothetical protein